MAIIRSLLDAAGSREAIAMQSRPAYLVKDGTFAVDEADEWRKLLPHRSAIEKAIAATGRIETDDPVLPFVGTAFLIDPKRAVTANYVADALRWRRDEKGRLQGVRLNLRAEAEAGVERIFVIDDFLRVHPYWGFAFLELREAVDAATASLLTLAKKQSPKELTGREICAIGYPAKDSREDEGDLERIFGNIFGVKRLMPGVISGTGRWGSEDSFAFLHDATTTGGASGAPLVDIETGAVIGVHVGGQRLTSNHAVPAWEIGRDPQWVMNRPVNGGSAERDSVSTALASLGATVNEQPIFTADEVIKLHEILVDAGVTDDTQIAVLFSALPPEVTATFPNQGAPSVRLMLMLHKANGIRKVGEHSAFYYILKSGQAIRSWDENWKKAVGKLLADVLEREAKT